MHLMCLKNEKEASVSCRMKDGETKERGSKESKAGQIIQVLVGLFMSLVFSLKWGAKVG